MKKQNLQTSRSSIDALKDHPWAAANAGAREIPTVGTVFAAVPQSPAQIAKRLKDAVRGTRLEEISPTDDTGMKSIFSVDVEDWFHILDVPSAPPISEWDSLPSCVEGNFMRMLDIFSEKQVKITCFVLGWVAQRFPHLVKEAALRGHEIASHGYSHRLTYQLSRKQFYEDIFRTRTILEDLIGTQVFGYRAPSFSTTEWFFETVAEAGYCYDASVFPAVREHGGNPNHVREPHVMTLKNAVLFEFPTSVCDILGKAMCFAGGGYLRILPLPVIQHMSRKVIRSGNPVVFYIHPREIDPHHPRLPMNGRRRFKCYVNLDTTEFKLSHILDEFPVTTFVNYIITHGQSMKVLDYA